MQAEIEIPDWATRIVSDHTDMDRNPHAVDATKVRSFSFRLPDDAYFEYAFFDADGRMRADPGNPLRAENPWYPEASAIVGPDYRQSPYARPPEELGSGTLDRHRVESRALASSRRFTVYTPQGLEEEWLPVVLVQDGVAFLRVGNLHRVLEALLVEGEALPARLVFVEPQDRWREYAFDASYRDFLTDELLPFLTDRYPATGETVALGASLGGLVSGTLAILRPDLFTCVVAFSGAWLGTPEERDFYRSTRSWIVERAGSAERLPGRWYTEVGTFEWLLDVNRQLRDVLAERGCQHRYRERNAGHNWVSWRNGLAEGLRFALQPGRGSMAT